MMVEKYDSEKNTITVQPFERRNTMQLNIATDYAVRESRKIRIIRGIMANGTM